MKKLIIILMGISAFYFVFNFSPHQTIDTHGSKRFAYQKNIVHAYNYGDATLITKQLLDPSEKNGEWAHKVYRVTRALYNVAALIALFMFAFANILHINIETYAIKKLLPRLLVATVFVNLAFPIFALVSRFVDTLEGVKLFQPLGGRGLLEYLFDWKSFLSTGGITVIVAAITLAVSAIPNIVGVGIAILLLFGSTILIALLSMLLSFRPVIILIGVAVAPLAIAASLFQPTEGLFKKWLKIMAIWLFLNIMVNFILQLVKLIP